MTKKEFLDGIRKKLTGLPQNDIDRSIGFYDELIQDVVEDGVSEEKAVESLGSIDEIVEQILSETSVVKIKKPEKRKFKAWEIILIVLGFPVWLPLVITAFSIILTLYICICSMLFSFYSVDFSLAAAALGSIFLSFKFLFSGDILQSCGFLGTALVCGGLAILIFLGLNAVVKFLTITNKKLFTKIFKSRRNAK